MKVDQNKQQVEFMDCHAVMITGGSTDSVVEIHEELDILAALNPSNFALL